MNKWGKVSGFAILFSLCFLFRLRFGGGCVDLYGDSKLCQNFSRDFEYVCRMSSMSLLVC